MTLTRQHGMLALFAAAALLITVWIARHSEWVDETVAAPPTAAMRQDPLLRLKRLLTRAGATLVAPDNLDRFPPREATFVLDNFSWNLFPEREAALRRWVEAGGALVIPNFEDAGARLDWVPIHTRQIKAAELSTSMRPSDRARCSGVREPAGITPAFGTPRSYDTCVATVDTLTSSAKPTWALDTGQGHVVLRVPVGAGSVTASSTALPWGNNAILERDNALIALASLQAAPGRAIWIVSGESLPPLLTFLWTRGAPAVLLGAAALGSALWRSAARFGPRIAPVSPVRRSMAEQIRGTAQFIARRGGVVLHAAQVRALIEAARERLQGFEGMGNAARAQAIAAATGLDPGALGAALDPAPDPIRARHPASSLALLEIARRRLLVTRQGRSAPIDPGRAAKEP